MSNSQTDMTHVVLLRAAKAPEDTYQKAFHHAGFSVHFVKALCFEYVNSEEVVSSLQMKHGGVIFTSQTAVESVLNAISLVEETQVDTLKQWKDIPVFVVGKATAATVKKLGLEVCGSATGNAELLGDEIVNYFSGQEKCTLQPLLFLCGNLAQDTIPSKLEGVGLKVHSVVCYNTTRDPALEQSLYALSQQGIFCAQCWIVFFSPSGVQFALPLLQSYFNVHTLKVAAIGPTTAEPLKLAGLRPVVAHKPSPEALLNAMQKC